MTGADDRPEEFRPPTALESAVRALGADTIRYRVDYIMLPMREHTDLPVSRVRKELVLKRWTNEGPKCLSFRLQQRQPL